MALALAAFVPPVAGAGPPSASACGAPPDVVGSGWGAWRVAAARDPAADSTWHRVAWRLQDAAEATPEGCVHRPLSCVVGFWDGDGRSVGGARVDWDVGGAVRIEGEYRGLPFSGGDGACHPCWFRVGGRLLGSVAVEGRGAIGADC